MFKLSANLFLLTLACFLFFPQAKCLESYVTPEVSPLFGKSLVHNGKSIVPCRIFRPDRKTGSGFLQFLYATYEVIPAFNRSTNISQLNFLGVGLTNQMDQSSTRIHVSLSTEGKEIYRLSVPYKTTSNYTEATSLEKFRWFTSPESRIFEVKVSFPLQDLYLPKYDKNKVLPAGVYDVEVYVRNTKKDEERSCIRIHRAFTVYPVKIPVKLSLMSPLIGNPLIAGNLTVVNGSISSPFQSWDRVYVDISNNGKNMTFLPRITANDSIPFDYLAENVTLSLTLRRVGSFYPAVPASETILHLLDQQSDGCNNIHSVNLTFISQTVGYFVMPYCADSRWELSYTFPDNYHRIEAVLYSVETGSYWEGAQSYYEDLILSSPLRTSLFNQTVYSMFLIVQSLAPSLNNQNQNDLLDLPSIVQGVLVDPIAQSIFESFSSITPFNNSIYVSAVILLNEIKFIEQLTRWNHHEGPVVEEINVSHYNHPDFASPLKSSPSKVDDAESTLSQRTLTSTNTANYSSLSTINYCNVTAYTHLLQQLTNTIHVLDHANEVLEVLISDLPYHSNLNRNNTLLIQTLNVKILFYYSITGTSLKVLDLLIQQVVDYQNSCYVLCDLNQLFAYSVYPVCNVTFSLPPWNQQIQGPNVDVNGCYGQLFPDISKQVRYLLSGPYCRVGRIFSLLPLPLHDVSGIYLNNVNSLFNYHLDRREIEVTKNIVFQYSDSCDISDWTSITCICYFQDSNNNGEIDIFYRLAPTLPTIRKTFRVYLQYLPQQHLLSVL
eukprot:gene5337-5723_t